MIYDIGVVLVFATGFSIMAYPLRFFFGAALLAALFFISSFLHQVVSVGYQNDKRTNIS